MERCGGRHRSRVNLSGCLNSGWGGCMMGAGRGSGATGVIADRAGMYVSVESDAGGRGEVSRTGYLVGVDGSTHSVGEGLPEIECFRCGVCCILYRPRVDGPEIERIARCLDMPEELFRATYVRSGATGRCDILDEGKGRCPFLVVDEETGVASCRIHACRPQACRDWRASLARSECQEGLRGLKRGAAILLPADLPGRGSAGA